MGPSGSGKSTLLHVLSFMDRPTSGEYIFLGHNVNELTDLETSARFYIEDNGEIHLHSNFLLDTTKESKNVTVAFVLKDKILFKVCG